jgi:hypothetical protein
MHGRYYRSHAGRHLLLVGHARERAGTPVPWPEPPPRARPEPPPMVPVKVPLTCPSTLDTFNQFEAVSGTMAGTSARGTARARITSI